MILINKNLKVLVQGITGKQGSFHTKLMLDYGTNIVAGVTPGKGGHEVHGVPVFDTVKEAVDETGANSSIIFVPARYAYTAITEAIVNKLSPIIVITEKIPTHDMIRAVRLSEIYGVRIIGPNTPGLIVPGLMKLGIMPDKVFKKGEVAILSRSGTLTYEIAHTLTRNGIGQSIVVGIGGDPIVGTTFTDLVKLLKEDHETKAIVIIGEIGGAEEERLAKYIMRHDLNKPIVAFIAGRTAPPGRRMGHAGAIILPGGGTYESKVKAFKGAGIKVAIRPAEIADLITKVI